MDDITLINNHAAALFRHNHARQLLTVNEPDGVHPAPRFYFGRSAAGNIWRFRDDLPNRTVDALEARCRREPVAADLRAPPVFLADYLALLGAKNYESGPAYVFESFRQPLREVLVLTPQMADRLDGAFRDLRAELPAWQPFCALAVDGQIVSVCRSVRITSQAHEAGVETLAAHRGNGYACDVVLAWANRVRALGALATYSTGWDNGASQALAKKLNLRMYGADFHIDE